MPPFNVEGIPTWVQQRVQILYQRRLFLIRQRRNNALEDNDGDDNDEQTWLKKGAKSYIGELKELHEGVDDRHCKGKFHSAFLFRLIQEFNDDAEILIALLEMEIMIVPSSFLTFVSPRLQADKEFVLQILNKTLLLGDILKYALPNLLADKEFMRRAVKISGLCFEYASKPLQDDEALAALAIEKFPRPLEYASPRLQDNKQLVLNAIQKYGYPRFVIDCIQHVSSRLKNDYQVMQAAVRKNGHAIQHASVTLQKNTNIVVDAELSKIILPYPDSFLGCNEKPLPHTDDIVNQEKTPLSIFPYLLEKANDNPLIVYYCLKNRNGLIPTTRATSSSTQQNNDAVIVDDTAASIPPIVVDPPNGDKKRKRSSSSSSSRKHKKKRKKKKTKSMK